MDVVENDLSSRHDAIHSFHSVHSFDSIEWNPIAWHMPKLIFLHLDHIFFGLSGGDARRAIDEEEKYVKNQLGN